MNDVHRKVGDLTQLTPGNETAKAQIDARAGKLTEALKFIKELSGECLENGDVRVGTAAEVAMRHIYRRADEVL